MRAQKILVTGGAGFIGTNLTSRLKQEDHFVRWLDNLDAQVHESRTKEVMLRDGHADHFVIGDVRSHTDWNQALEGIDVVVHLAAQTGTAQSMYRIAHYAEVNVGGTALLWDVLANQKTSVRKVVIASSRAIYGEGAYTCSGRCGVVVPQPRTTAALRLAQWEPICPRCGAPILAIATPESSLPAPASAYAVTKLSQEQLSLAMGRALGIPTIALRLQNVYGPGQSLRNPYTGIISILSNQMRQDLPIEIYEDGHESRDFVFIEDVVSALAWCLDVDCESPIVLNVGSGKATSIHDLAAALKLLWRSSSPITVTGTFRTGDIRHNWADLSQLLRLWPTWESTSALSGLEKYVTWAKLQPLFEDRSRAATAELKARGL